MPYSDFSSAEIVARGEAIYRDRLREEVEAGNSGKFLVLDIETGEYEIDRDDATATVRLMERIPDAVIYGLRIGYRAAYRFRSPIRVTTGSGASIERSTAAPDGM